MAGRRPCEVRMDLSRLEALTSAKKLCRTLDSAPSSQARAQAIFSELSRAEGWSTKEQEEIATFGRWLFTRPPPTALKARIQKLIAALR